MKITSLLLPTAAAALLATAIFAATTGAQAPPAMPASGMDMQAPPQAPPPQGAGQIGGPGGRPMRNYPPPTNLKVLPKDLTGRQVRDMMETWAGSLGVHCDFCHAPDPSGPGPNGRPRLKYDDDSKPNKQIARIMYSMTEQMNKDYITKATALDTDHDKDNMGKQVTCGTCHRGHEMPEEFVIPREQRGGPGAGPGGPPPAGATPPPAGAAPPATQ